MILIDLIYLSIYSFFRRVLNKYSFDVPETAAVGVLAFLIGFSLNISYYYLLHESNNYSKKAGGIILISGIIVMCVVGFLRYVSNGQYAVLYKKYKPALIIPGLVVIVWLCFLATQIKKIYL
ncbi:MAG: hypothetical protein ACYDCN_08250 [Bacteroidia bacterium]